MTKISADVDLFGDLESDFRTLGPDIEPVLIEWYGQNYGKAVQHVTAQGLGRVTSTEGVDGESSFAQTNPRAATWAKARAGDLIVDIAASAKEETIAKLKSVLGEAYDNPNVTRQDVTDAISELWDTYPDWKADLISRTETAFAENGGTLAGYKDTGVEFVLVSDGTSDDICAAADGATWTVDAADANPLGHPNAVLAGSSFASYGPVSEMRRAEFDGPAIRLRTTDGHETTIGPNHPMLTSGGMTPAKALQKGDQLVYDLRSDPIAGTVLEADRQQVPSVEDVFESFRSVGSHTVIACTSDDLHGDGAFCQSEVEVVWPARELLKVEDAGRVQHVRELFLVGSDPDLNTEAGQGASLTRNERVVIAASRGMGSIGGPGHLVLLEVASVEQVSYVGAVLDCTTETSLYCSDGFVVSNCSRSFSPLDSTEVNPDDVSEPDE